MVKAPLAVSKFRLIFAVWWVIWSGLQAGTLYWLGFPFQVSVTDSLLSNLLLLATCMLVSHNLQYYLPRQERYWYLLVLSIILSGLWFAAAKWLITAIIHNPAGYVSFLNKSWPIRFGIAFLLIACMAMISMVWYTFEEQKEQEHRKSETEKLTREAELYKLRGQLQPHFLFNSLNSISALIGSRPQQARTMIQQLSDFLRGTLKKEDQQWISLPEELQYLALYLSIEKVRFGHRLNTVVQSDEASEQGRLPALLLQPIVENAIKFGLYDTTGEVTIRIDAKTTDDYLVITVQNPFDTETAQTMHGTGFGLSSVQRRLQLLFARTDLLITATQQNIFMTTVKIPIIHDSSADR